MAVGWPATITSPVAPARINNSVAQAAMAALKGFVRRGATVPRKSWRPSSTMETMPCAPNIASVAAHAVAPICSSFNARSPPTPAITEKMVAPARTTATANAASGMAGEFCIGAVPLLDGDRAVHAQLIVAGLGTEELVRARFVVRHRRGA